MLKGTSFDVSLIVPNPKPQGRNKQQGQKHFTSPKPSGCLFNEQWEILTGSIFLFTLATRKLKAITEILFGNY